MHATREPANAAMTTTAETISPSGTPSARTAADALARTARLEALLGDPYDPANPHGLRALSAADDRRTPPAETESLLAEAGLGAESVPAVDGGRLTRADLLVRALRPVFRRDVALGFGYGITSRFAAGADWAAGDALQRLEVADLLLRGGRATILHHEPAHADAILRHEFSARPTASGYRLDGRKDVITNAARADLQVVYARTGTHAPRSHSVFLLDPRRAPADGVRYLSRVELPGMRGALFSGLDSTAAPLPPETLVGGVGDCVAVALRVFQVNRSVICGLVIAAAGTVLHAAVRTATGGRAGPVAGRRGGAPLTGVFADLLAADAMAMVVLRALGLLPDQAHLFACCTRTCRNSPPRSVRAASATPIRGTGRSTS
ncbi:MULTISPECIES: acyl-CoA dehydrogenase family protein [unclassified Streptomyces]|uniref:acyl-CoA dehydrogenase family protein n=1 Tax=unclassified Streptomyces TaxID=2593676 RepID=UPI003326C5B2